MRMRPVLRAATSSVVAAFLALGGVAVAASAASSTPTKAERKVMIKAAHSNLAEIEEGRLAMTHSKNPEVQALGNRLVQDHSRAQAALEGLAGSMDVKLPAKPDAKQLREIAKLRKLKGAAFDEVFDPAEVRSHEHVIAEMQRSKGTVRNPALKGWIAEVIPVLQEHLQLARSLPQTKLAGGQTSQPAHAATASNRPGTAAGTDHALLTKSAQGNIAEIELGRLATTRSTNPVVQDLGTRLTQDGSKGVANLEAVAGMLHVQLPAKPSSSQQRQISALSKLKGPTFDRRFEQIALQDERRMLGEFQSGASAARNPAVKATVKDMVPIVEEHLQIARAIPNQYPSREASAAKGTAR